MDGFNILFAAALIFSFTKTTSGVKKNFTGNKKSIITKPDSFLQKTPPNISAMIILLQFIALAGIGSFEAENNLLVFRVLAFAGYIAMIFLQSSVIKTMGEIYNGEIIIYKNHPVITSGPFKYMRHPQYFAQTAGNIFASIVLLNPWLLGITLFVEIPLYYKRAKLEESLLSENSAGSYPGYIAKTYF